MEGMSLKFTPVVVRHNHMFYIKLCMEMTILIALYTKAQ